MRRLFALLMAASLGAAAQQVPTLDAADALRASRAALGRTVQDRALLDVQGRPVRLAAFRGKPLLVSFIYTGCFQVCPANTRALDDAVGTLQSRFGAEAFSVVSIGFNQPADSPQAMRDFALRHRIARPHWAFLSAPAAVVPELAADFGFRYAATASGFDHVLQVSLLDAQGRIVRQVHGPAPSARDIEDALASLVAGEALPAQASGPIDAVIERIRILCTVYDPVTGRTRVDYSLALEIAGGITFILFMALYMLNEWWTRRRQRRHAARPEIA